MKKILLSIATVDDDEVGNLSNPEEIYGSIESRESFQHFLIVQNFLSVALEDKAPENYIEDQSIKSICQRHFSTRACLGNLLHVSL